MKKQHTKISSQPAEKISDFAFQKTTLSEGVRVITERIPHVRSVSLGFWLEVGTRDESPDINGISHFIEHMLFKGTSRRSAIEIARSIEDVGGTLNAYTSKDLTCYYAQVLEKDLPLAVDVISDMLTDSLFEPAEVKKEIDVILDEIRSADEVPEDRIHDYFYKNLFDSHPLAQPTLGTTETVSRFSRDKALQYMRDQYSCNRLVISASGNVDHDALIRMLEGKFATWPQATERIFPELPSPQKQVDIKTEDALQAHICMGSRGLAYTDSRRYSALVLNTLLGSGMSSRLFQNIREKYGICYSIYSYLDFLYDTGVFCIYASTDKDKLDFTLELIERELEDLKKQPIAQDELERTKSQLKGNLLLGLESTANRMSRLAKMEIYLQQQFSLDEIIQGIDAVTCESVWELSQILLNSDKFITTIIRPE